MAGFARASSGGAQQRAAGIMQPMRITDEMLALLERALHGTPVPKVRALHLPPALWSGTGEGEFGAIELDDGSFGLSYVLLDGLLDQLAPDARGVGADLIGTTARSRSRAAGQGRHPASARADG
jgi:hypothetical protein